MVSLLRAVLAVNINPWGQVPKPEAEVETLGVGWRLCWAVGEPESATPGQEGVVRTTSEDIVITSAVKQ